MSVKVGDWISFYQSGQIIISEVRYRRKHKAIEKWDACTQDGAVEEEYILEVRSPKGQP